MGGASAAGPLQTQRWLQHQVPLAELVAELWQGPCSGDMVFPIYSVWIGKLVSLFLN